MDIEDFRKQLIYRSWHRGCKETDIILGNYAKAKLSNLDENQLNLYAEFIDENDWDIYAWMVGSMEIPEKYNNWLIKDLKEFSSLV